MILLEVNDPASTKEAAELLFEAASAGHISSQFNLSSLFFKGRGQCKDPRNAKRWCLLAADGGHPGAAQRLCKYYKTKECFH